MAYTAEGVNISREAAADLSAKQFTFVKLDATGKAVACDTLGEATIGVLQNKPKTGEAALIRVFGVSKLTANAAIALASGRKVVTPAATGKAAAAAAGHFPAGYLLEAASADGHVVTAMINPGDVAVA